MTWNARGAAIPNPPLMAYVDRTRPDLVLIQEAGTVRPRDLPRGWQVAGGASGVVAVSRRPIREDGRLTEKHLGAPGACARYQIETPVGPIEVVNVHLPTPRPGIEAVLHSRLAGVQTLEEVTDARDGASRTARNWAGDPVDGLIVGGDFNTPSESVIFQRDWVGFTDAFASGGNGWGATKQTRWYGLRIDHRLFAPPWRCRDAQVGPAMGSDHRPVIADLVFDVE